MCLINILKRRIMNVKRLLSAALLVLALCPAAMAQQRLDITLKDKSIVSCTLDDINYMEIVEGANPGELDGVWFLGWKVTSGAATNSNGSEMLVFYAGKMKWVKKTTEYMYTLTYPEGGATVGSNFKGLREGSATALTYTIFAMEGDMLVLKQGTTRYYFYKTKEAAITAMKPENGNYLTRAQYTTGEAVWNSNIKGGNSHSTKTPMGQHFENYAAATDADREWLANPNNQPDMSWHELNGSSRSWKAQTITLYPMNSGTPVPADVNQHDIGDCCMCAVFASFAYIYPEWIKSIIEKDGNNYTVHMFDPKGNPVDVVVDNKVFCNGNDDIFQVSGKNKKYNWATIMEKALMKWETRFKCNKIGGIGTEHAAPPFTGNGDSYSFDWGDKLYNSEYPLLVEYAIDNGMISVGGFHEGGVPMGDLGSVTAHAFTVMKTDEGADYLFVMRNPWGNEPSGSTAANRTDGKLKIPNDHQKLRLIDFRFVYPGAQMAEYKKENLGGYTPPRFRPMYIDMNPSVEMLRMYNVEGYKPFPMPEGAKLDDFVEELSE